jgi:predicted nucleotidyltransferase component of viral defense system
MKRKRLSANYLVRDVQAGLSDAEIQDKYSLSRKEMRKILKELVKKGEISPSDVESRRDYFFKRIRRFAIIAMFSDDDLMNRLVLKGGNALDIAYSMKFRSSIDLDFSMDGEFTPEEMGDIRDRFEKCLHETFVLEGYEVFDVTFKVKPPQVTPDMADFWGGYLVEFKIIEKAKHAELTHDLDSLRKQSAEVDPSSRKKFRIEISKFEYCARKREQDLDHYTIYVYSPEQIVVEKIRSICQQMPEYGKIVKSSSQSPRPRDFCDIYVTIERFKIDLSNDENLDLVRCSFESKRVPLKLISRIMDYRDYHSQAFEGVKDTVYAGTTLKEFDFYFDYVVRECEKLKPLWEE